VVIVHVIIANMAGQDADELLPVMNDDAKLRQGTTMYSATQLILHATKSLGSNA